MRILLISSYIFGYLTSIVDALREMNNEVEVLYYEREPLKFRYKNRTHHLTSFLKKATGGHAKKEFRHKIITERYNNEQFDQILIIHPQYLGNATHKFLRKHCGEYKTFLFDSLKKMPRQRNVLKYFDEIFSYEKKDCAEHGFKFLTNFIPFEIKTDLGDQHIELDFFNISSHDRSRLPLLLKIAQYLEQKEFPFEFLIFSKKIKKMLPLRIIDEKMSIAEVHEKMMLARVLVDIQRHVQDGLSFRVFEAMGLHKKLISTNTDIVNYDFYHPNNILVIDPENIAIPPHFVNTPYKEISESLYNKYRPEGWIDTVFSDQNK